MMKEDKPLLIGVIVVIVVASLLNLLLKYEFGLSVVVGVIAGVVVGLAANKMLGG